LKAIAYDKYGSFEILALSDIDKPAVNDGGVLVRHAAGLQTGRMALISAVNAGRCTQS